jgi:hypothetical protein
VSRRNLTPASSPRCVVRLEATFPVEFLPLWFTNIGKHLVTFPKVHLIDTGLMAHLLGLAPERLMCESSQTILGWGPTLRM